MSKEPESITIDLIRSRNDPAKDAEFAGLYKVVLKFIYNRHRYYIKTKDILGMFEALKFAHDVLHKVSDSREDAIFEEVVYFRKEDVRWAAHP